MNKSRRISILILALASVALGADSPPPKAKKKLTLQDLINATASPSRKTTSVAGVRGLEETSGQVDAKARDYAAVERLEHLVVHDDDLQKFMGAGKLK